MKGLFIYCIAITLLCINLSCREKENATFITDTFKQNKTELRKADSIYSIAYQRHVDLKLSEAIPFYDMADSLYQLLDVAEKVILSKVYKSGCLTATFQPLDSVFVPLNEALLYAQDKNPMMFEKGMLYHRLALAHLQKMDLETSRGYELKAIEILEAAENIDRPELLTEKVRAYQYLTFIEEYSYNFVVAQKLALKTLELASMAKRDSTKAFASLVSITIKLQEYKKVEALFKRAEEEAYFENAPLYNVFDFYQWKANYLMDTQQYDKALATIEELQDIVEKSSYKDHYSGWYLNYTTALAYLKKGNFEEAIRTIEKFNPDNRSLNVMIAGEAKSRDLLLLSDAYLELGEIELSKKYIQKAIDISFSEEYKPDNFFGHIDLTKAHPKNVGLYSKLLGKAKLCAQIYENTKEVNYLNTALETYELLHQLIKMMGSRSDEDQFIGDEDFINTYEPLFQMYHSKWKENPSEELFFAALNICDESKTATILNELKSLRQEKLFANVPVDILEKEKMIQKKMDSVLLLYDVTQSTKNTTLVKVKDSLEIAFENLKQELKKDHFKYYHLKYGTEESIDAIISSSYRNYNLIEFFYGNQNIFIFNKNGDTHYFDKVPLTDTLKQHIEKVLLSLRNFNSLEFKESGGYVYQNLFKKYIDSTKKTIVILDGKLHLIPIESLWVPLKDKPHFLLEETSVLRLNSIKQDITLFSKKPAKTLLFATYATTASLENTTISSSLSEVNKIEKIINGAIFLDEDAAKNVFIEQAINYSIIHLATHSSINNFNPLKSKIHFYENKTNETSNNSLKLEELYSLKLNSELVTLSSCETGIGKEVKGRGVLSISNAFSYAGVSSTVMSLWKVPDKETSTIMVSFYKHLKKGIPKDEALQNAKKDYLQNTTDVSLRHPYYWAGFVISGDTSPLQISTSNNYYWFVAIGLAVLLFLLLGIRKSRLKQL